MADPIEQQPADVQRRVKQLVTEVRKPQYNGLSNADVRAALNAKTTYTATAPFGPPDLKSLLSPASLDHVISLPAFDVTMLPLLKARDPKSAEAIQSIALWIGTLAGAGRITPGEFAAIAALVGRSDTYTDGPSIGESLGCPAVQDFEVELARSVV